MGQMLKYCKVGQMLLHIMINFVIDYDNFRVCVLVLQSVENLLLQNRDLLEKWQLLQNKA